MKMNPIKKMSQSALVKNFKSEFSRLKLKKFEQKVAIDLRYKNFQIKTAENYDELMQVLQLRYDVFHNEKNSLKANRHLIDWDDFDLVADHILVKDLDDNQTLATYRFICSKFTDKFYSEQEFDLSRLLKQEAVFLELGRACVDMSRRRTNIIYLIWKGLANYMHLVQSAYVFGCTSVDTIDFGEAQAIYSHLKENYFDDRFDITPLDEFRFNTIEQSRGRTDVSEQEAADFVPTLLKSYISAGSKIASLPAIDRDFNCIDLFTILDCKNITPKYQKKYFGDLVN